MKSETNYSFISHLKNINPDWKSKSRIFGKAIEDWVEENFLCECSGKFQNQIANSKSIDSICLSCGHKIQIKGSKNKFKPNKNNILKIMGAEYNTTLNSIISDDWDLILVSYCEKETSINQVIRIKYDQISEQCVIPRTPLKETARRAGWQGCYLEFNWEELEVLYDG